MRIFSYPFRLTQNGSIATVEQNSSTAAAEQIAMLVLTEKGERQMVPAFGITDPTFSGIDPSELALGLSIYGPDVSIVGINAYYQDDATLAITLEFNDGNKS